MEAIIYRAFNTDVFIVDTEDVLHRYEESCPYCKYISIGIKIENKSAVCKYIPIRNLSDKMYRSRIKVYKDGSELKTICICSGFKENNIVPPGDSAFIELKMRDNLLSVGKRKSFSLRDFLDDITVCYEIKEEDKSLSTYPISDIKFVLDKNIAVIQR